MNRPLTILLIEDEANIRNFLKTLLLTNNYQVFLAENAAQGKMMFMSHCPDLVLLDLGLPDKDGLEVLKEIREEVATLIDKALDVPLMTEVKDGEYIICDGSSHECPLSTLATKNFSELNI